MSDHMETSGATFIVGQVNFRCIDIIGTETPLFECNVCTSVITDPKRHLRQNNCEVPTSPAGSACRACQHEAVVNVPRLIEELRVARAEVERLQDEYQAEVGRLQAEVERLQDGGQDAEIVRNGPSPDHLGDSWRG